MNHKEIGLDYFRIVWYAIANKVVEKAIQVYNLNESQAIALKKAFLKSNHYYAIMN